MVSGYRSVSPNADPQHCLPVVILITNSTYTYLFISTILYCKSFELQLPYMLLWLPVDENYVHKRNLSVTVGTFFQIYVLKDIRSNLSLLSSNFWHQPTSSASFF
jgi:hypothetical protein